LSAALFERVCSRWLRFYVPPPVALATLLTLLSAMGWHSKTAASCQLPDPDSSEGGPSKNPIDLASARDV
jgi:hypothetical protein